MTELNKVNYRGASEDKEPIEEIPTLHNSIKII